MQTFTDRRQTRSEGGREKAPAPSQVPPQALGARLAAVARAFREKPFTPHPLARSGHAQTIASSFRLGRYERLRDEQRRLFESRLVEVEPGTRLLLKCRWQQARRDAPTALFIHGLEGSSDSTYMLGTAHKAFAAGFNVACMNMRNCGDTEHLTTTLYHSGMTGDIRAVMEDELAGRERLREIFVAGFSMSGNMVLRLAAEYRGDAPRALAGVAAVSPSIDLRGCAERIERAGNSLYQWSFMRSLRRRVRRKHRLHPALYDARGLRGLRTIRQFDERFTAPHGGYRDADDYYDRASSFAVIRDIEVPTLVIHSADDPIIPDSPFRDPSIAANPNVLLVLTERGGHVGFIADARGAGEDNRWAENRVVEFFGALARETREDSSRGQGG